MKSYKGRCRDLSQSPSGQHWVRRKARGRRKGCSILQLRGKEEGADMELQDEAQELITLADLVPVPLSDPSAVRLRMSGECRLLWPVLEDGIECYLRYGDHPSAVLRELFQEANDWIE